MVFKFSEVREISLLKGKNRDCNCNYGSFAWSYHAYLSGTLEFFKGKVNTSNGNSAQPNYFSRNAPEGVDGRLERMHHYRSTVVSYSGYSTIENHNAHLVNMSGSISRNWITKLECSY